MVAILSRPKDVNIFAMSNEFSRATGLAPGPNHILLKKQNVFISAVGRSFHERCFPSGTIHLVISANALHHLSKGWDGFEFLVHASFSNIYEVFTTIDKPLIFIALI